MDPNTVLILSTIKAGFECVSDGFKFFTTPEGQLQLVQIRTDRVAWEQFWAKFGTGVQDLFTGKLFNPPTPPTP